MRLIPTHCTTCSRFELVEQSALHSGETSCGECGARASALPGESYTENDRPLFDGFVQSLREAGVDATKAVQLLRELEESRKGRISDRIQALVESQPSLGNLEVIALQHARRKAEGVLLLVLGAIANRRIQSGFLRAVSDDSANAGEKAR
jgi:hypothetical protein